MQSGTPPHCSIIIPVYNRAAITKQCLNALLAQDLAGLDAEIVVVDDGSRDLTPRLLDTYSERIRVVTHGANMGFASACNDGASTALGDYLVFLNNDTIPRAGWLDALLQYARSHPRAAVVGSKLLYPDATIQHAGVVFAAPGFPMHLYAGFPEDHPAVNKSRRFQAVTGACMLVRRGPFEALGGFDRAYRNLFEDVDLCLRMGQCGHEVHYCHTSEVVHLEGMTRYPTEPVRDTVPDPTLDSAHSVGLYRLRWMGRVQSDHWRYYEDDGLVSISRFHPYPLRLSVSPHVAVLDGEQDALADRLLDQRASQVYNLLQENSHLKARLADLELHVLADLSSGRPALPTTWPELLAGLNGFEVREHVANLYLKGAGIEIGALSAPLQVRSGVRVRYVDRLPVAELRKQYPELNALPLTEADILDDGERLDSISDCSQDFVIANHFIEHCQDPIGTMQAFLRVTRPGGVLFMAIPDKRYTFDAGRPITPLRHLLLDNVEGPDWSKRQHFEEWAEFVNHMSGKDAICVEADRLMEMNYSVHYHVWTQAEILELLSTLHARLQFVFDVEVILRNGIELIVVLRKNPPAGSVDPEADSMHVQSTRKAN